MIVLWILFACSMVVLPATALLALHWAVRHGEFRNLPRTALSIFDEDEPVGRQTDYFPGEPPASLKIAPPAGAPPAPSPGSSSAL